MASERPHLVATFYELAAYVNTNGPPFQWPLNGHTSLRLDGDDYVQFDLDPCFNGL